MAFEHKTTTRQAASKIDRQNAMVIAGRLTGRRECAFDQQADFKALSVNEVRPNHNNLTVLGLLRNMLEARWRSGKLANSLFPRRNSRWRMTLFLCHHGVGSTRLAMWQSEIPIKARIAR
jgi:hypothetical protein